jgi:hypothetical protein
MSRNYYAEINLHITWHTKDSAPLLIPAVEAAAHHVLPPRRVQGTRRRGDRRRDQLGQLRPIGLRQGQGGFQEFGNRYRHVSTSMFGSP